MFHAQKHGFLYSVFKVHRAISASAPGVPYAVFFVPLAIMILPHQKTAINSFCDISRIFFFFLRGGAFW